MLQVAPSLGAYLIMSLHEGSYKEAEGALSMPVEQLCRQVITRATISSQVCGRCPQPHLFCNTGVAHLSLCPQIMGHIQQLLWPKRQCSRQRSCP